MKVTRQLNWWNMPVWGDKFSLKGATLFLGIGFFSWWILFTPLFRWNFLAIISYFAFIWLIVGETPTGRSMIFNFYGIIFKKPVKMVVTELSTTTTIGHSIRSIDEYEGVDAVGSKMSDGHVRLVYNMTSDINQWSTREDHSRQAIGMKQLFNILEGGEAFYIVVKEDSDTSMLQLKNYLDDLEHINEDDSDLLAMSHKRKEFLRVAGTESFARSVQQYGILSVKVKNLNRCISAFKSTGRLIRVANEPVSVLLAAMGFEGGLDKEYGSIQKTKK